VCIIAVLAILVNQNLVDFFPIKNPAQGRVFVVILQQIIAKLG
jgi:hypothetical protein